MAKVSQGEVLDGGGIRFTRDYLVEVEQDRLIHRIQRSEIMRIALRWGLVAPRPAIQAGLGISCLLGSAFLLVGIIRGLMAYGGKVEGRLLVGLAVFVGVGGWLFVEAWKKGFYLEVQTKNGVEKRRFDRKASREEIEAFLASVQSRLGWIIGSASIEEVGRAKPLRP
ncbi:MAG: hypothetical protein ABJC13_00145 [Acidobacteriota bacterium]